MTNELAPVRNGLRGVARNKASPSELAVLEFQSPTAALIARPIPVTARITVWIIAAMFVSLVVVAGVMPINRVVVTKGTLVSKSPNAVIQPLETSIVRAINVDEGQVVRKGDLLAELDPTFSGADAADYGAQVESLQAAVDRMTAEDENRPYRPGTDASGQVQAAIYASRKAELEYKLENYRQKIAGLQATVQRAMADVVAYRGRLVVAKAVEDKRRELEKLHVGSQLNTLAALDARLDQERNLQDSEHAITTANSDLQALIRERDGFVHQWRAELEQQLTDESRKLSDARENLKKATLRRKLVDVYADQDAVVLSVAKVSVGSVLQTADQFITLVPLSAPLEAEVLIPGDQSGFVHVGDPATISFDTFASWQYGTAKGTVRTVSADSFNNPSMDTDKMVKPQQKDTTGLGIVYYRARVSIDELKLHDTPPSFQLQPGMSLSADVEVGKRTVLGYMVGRVLPHFSESFREP
ncbi:MAG TPA: HlyD family type I secretion periplasmic adaptor subunit [Acetobacteraceae bacterium]|jgi:HlyD family secretion protein|nr:HlyD family type I secretion periplasmic adaptor subunit [Acetobacteraceae bacterium]